MYVSGGVRGPAALLIWTQHPQVASKFTSKVADIREGRGGEGVGEGANHQDIPLPKSFAFSGQIASNLLIWRGYTGVWGTLGQTLYPLLPPPLPWPKPWIRPDSPQVPAIYGGSLFEVTTVINIMFPALRGLLKNQQARDEFVSLKGQMDDDWWPFLFLGRLFFKVQHGKVRLTLVRLSFVALCPLKFTQTSDAVASLFRPRGWKRSAACMPSSSSWWVFLLLPL